MNFNSNLIKGISCYNACLLYVGAMLGYEYQIACANSYIFEYHHSSLNHTIGDRLEVEDHTIPDFAEKQLNLCFHKYQKNNTSVMCIHRELSFKNPVIITINSFFCPWSEFYNRQNKLHNIIVIRRECDRYYCIDPQAKQIYHFITRQQLDEMLCDSIYLWGGSKQGRINYNKIYIESRNKIRSGSIIKNLYYFYGDIQNLTKENLKEEYKKYLGCYWECFLFYKLAITLPRYHILYVDFLKCINKQLNISNFQKICRLIQKSADQWKLIQNKLLRSYLTDKLVLPNILESIGTVIQHETAIQKLF